MSLKKLLLLLAISLLSLGASAQVHVKGIVVDKNNEPIIGATVTEKGKQSNGTATGFDGDFTLTVASNKSHLVITSLCRAVA